MKNRIPKSYKLLMLLLITSASLSAQQFDDNQKQTILSQSELLLREYGRYGTLSENQNDISQNYVNRFKNLFAAGANLHNDIEAPGGKEISPEAYVNYLVQNYPAGISVQFSEQNPVGEIIQIGERHYYIVMKATKTWVGVFQGSKIVRKTVPLYFKIEFRSESSGKLYDFKFILVSDSEPKAPFQQLSKGLHVGIRASGGMLQTGSEDSQYHSSISYTIAPALQGGLQVAYFLTNYIGISVGAEYGMMQMELKAADIENRFAQIDIDNEEYERIIRADEITETHSINLLNIPVSIALLYQFNENLGIYGHIGAVAGLPLSKEYEVTTSLDYSGYYQAYNVELYNLPNYGFPSDVAVNSSFQLETQPLLNSGFATLGGMFVINRKIRFRLGVTANMGLGNMLAGDNPEYRLSEGSGTYNSLLYSYSKMALMSYGAEFGILIQLSKSRAELF